MGGGDEEDAVEVEARGGLAREGEMAIVDGIEGAAEDRQFQGVHRDVGQAILPAAGFQRLGPLESGPAASDRLPHKRALSPGQLGPLDGDGVDFDFLGDGPAAPRGTLEIFSTTS
jgi:hypothetical protein